MTAATIALTAAFLTFGGGIAGLSYDRLLPEHQVSDETRALINRVTGLVATMAALVLGLLIASANTFYNSQKSNLEILSGRVVELDRFGWQECAHRGDRRYSNIIRQAVLGSKD